VKLRARSSVRGALTACLGLVALQVATTDRGSAALGGGFTVLNTMVERIFSPDVPALPDFAHAVGRQEEPETTWTPPVTTEKPDSKFPGVTPDPRKIPVPGTETKD
jgi:hypothetical protein